MAKPRLSITERLRIAVTGQAKNFIPALSSIDSWDVGVPLAQYETKPEQLRANIGWVFAANNAIAEFCAAVDLKLYKVQKNGDKEEVLNHPILELLDNPMKAHTGEMMRQLHHTYINLVGESYLLMVKGGRPAKVSAGQLPDAIQVVPAHLVDFKLGKQRYSDSVVKYGQTEYKIEEVIRDFVPDPGRPYYGRSIVAAAAASIDVDEQMQSWNRRMFANNARPGLIFNLQGDQINPDVRERLKQQVQELYSNDGVFKSLVIENGEAKPYMLNQHDLDFLASRQFTKDEILAMFKVPPSVLGMTTDFNRANMDAARYMHMIINVVPRLRHEVRMWNNQLVKPYDPTLELDFENPVPEDVEAKLQAADKGVNAWMTIDEVREQYGLEPLPDNQGATLYMPINVAPLADIANHPTPTPPTENTDPAAANAPDEETAPEGKKSHPKPRALAAKK